MCPGSQVSLAREVFLEIFLETVLRPQGVATD
jgi:hypothetical protein